MKKYVLTILALLVLLCLSGCQNAEQVDQKVDTNIGDSQNIVEPSGDGALSNIPIMSCNLETRNISVGAWDLASNVFNDGASPVGTTSDPYSLYSLQWDGDKAVAGLQVYLEELNQFDTSFNLRPMNLDEVVKKGISITLSDNGELMLNNGDTTGSISGTEVSIDGMGEITPAMMQGNALATNGETAYYLQSIMGEPGMYLICTAINMETMSAENHLVGKGPFPYSQVDIEAFNPNFFAEENGIFYFCLTDAVFSFDPTSRVLSQMLTMDDLGLTDDTGDSRVQLSGITVYKGHLIIESTEYEGDVHISKIAHLCSIDGTVLKSISWDSQKELVVFPRS